MKKLYYISVLFSLLLFSCNDSFLDRPPLDELTDDNYWQTEQHVINAANACYPGLIGKDIVNMDCLGEDLIWYQDKSWRVISSGNYGSSFGTLNSQWNSRYTALYRCHYFLENYNRATSVPEEVRERYAAEVKVIRAFQYWLLTSFWGDVPFITKTLTVESPELYEARTNKYEIVDWILNDLEESYKYLPESIEPASDEFGRITQAAALTMKARLALQFADKEHPEYWEIASEAASRVMRMNKYGIYKTGNKDKDYENLFNFTGRASRVAANNETILAYVYGYDDNANTKVVHNLSRECHVPDQQARYMPSKAFCDSYLCLDGKPFGISELSDSSSYAAYFENRDPRMKQTVLPPGYAPYYGGRDGRDLTDVDNVFMAPRFNNDKKGSVSGTGFYCVKYVEPTKVPVYNTDDNDIIIMRYAEVLLIYAEAMFEQGKLTQDIVDQTINQLRGRVGMHPMILTELQQWGMDIREEIHRERRVELFMEGFRWFDVVRWKEGWRLGDPIKGVNKSWVNETQKDYISSYRTDNYGYLILDDSRQFVDPKNYLFCLPQEQMERNPNLKPNNPGWD